MFCTMFSFFVILLASFGMYKRSSASTEFIVPGYIACMAGIIIFAGTYDKKFIIDPGQLLNVAYIMNLIMSFLFSPTFVNSFFSRVIYNLLICYAMSRRI